MNTEQMNFLKKMDSEDPIQAYRSKFHIPPTLTGAEAIYFSGNSLGLQPKQVSSRIEEELEDWKKLAVRGHVGARRPWVSYQENFTDSLAKLCGAEESEVVAMNSLTANLHFLMASFYRPTTKRHKILIEASAFPSDRYAVASQIRFHGYSPDTSLVVVRSRQGEEYIRSEDLLEQIDRQANELALILLPGVQYYTGQAFPMKELGERSQKIAVPLGLDLAHAIGNLELDLSSWGVDFAVWCSYKYLNGGPGAIAGAFVHKRHHRSNLPRLEGWWGNEPSTRFQMREEFQPAEGVSAWQLSNVPVLSMAPLLSSLEMFDELGMSALVKKSQRMTQIFEELLLQELGEKIEILTPKERGCQLSLVVRGGRGREVFDKLSAAGVICDWREPAVIRVAPTPLYNTFEELGRFVEILRGAF